MATMQIEITFLPYTSSIGTPPVPCLMAQPLDQSLRSFQYHRMIWLEPKDGFTLNDILAAGRLVPGPIVREIDDPDDFFDYLDEPTKRAEQWLVDEYRVEVRNVLNAVRPR